MSVSGDGESEPRRSGGDIGNDEPRRSPRTSDRESYPSDRDDGNRELNRYARASRRDDDDGIPIQAQRPLGRLAFIVGAAVLGIVGFASPGSLLRGGVAWLLFLLAVASGWGFLVARLARVKDPDVGLRAVWGLSGYLAISGPLIALGLGSRPVILVLIGVGFAGFAWRELTTPSPCCARFGDAWRYARANPGLGVLGAVLVGIAVLNVVGAVVNLDRNPWDDDLAYTPLIKRLLDAGDLVEPFSFRRLGAYGGQTALQALGGARGTLEAIHLIDRGLCQLLVLLLAAGHARDRGTPALFVLLLGAVLLLLPETAINSAAAWSGVALFFALYRTVANGQWGLVGLVGAATCTLRQNFLPVVILFVVLSLIASRRDGGWKAVRPRLVLVASVATAVILPWWIAAYRSSDTFLFPIIDGTWNHALSVKPVVMSWAEELAYILWASIETSPLSVIPVLFAVLCVTRDHRFAAPLTSLFLAVALGFVFLVHGFAGTEPFHLWRYMFGFAIALAIALVIEIRPTDNADVSIPVLGRWLVLAALVLQILIGRGAIPKRFTTIAADLRQAVVIGQHGDPVAGAEAARYHALQWSVPSGARVAVMLDDPWLLDFSRNKIANLDTPGFASPSPQLPSFRGAEAMRSYLLEQGYRYVLLVRSDRSRYFFRRPFWVWRLFNDGELFAAMSAYTIDMIDSMATLSRQTTVLHDADGLVALDLGTANALVEPSPVNEAELRDTFVRMLAEKEGLKDAWTLLTRHDLRFEDGIAKLVFIDASVDDPAWFEVTHPRPPQKLRGKAARALYRRAHLRVRGSTDMLLSIRARVAINSVFTRPRLDVSLGGHLLTSAVADANGRYSIDVRIPSEKLTGGWQDIYLISSSVIEPEKELRDLRIGRLESVEWRKAP
ncbi:MAG: hypothetical protein H0T46_14975 [Deltaproteobacteria bacterium]|nr:hypothetical protein [Deltaproteobacteria bacterium]